MAQDTKKLQKISNDFKTDIIDNADVPAHLVSLVSDFMAETVKLFKALLKEE